MADSSAMIAMLSRSSAAHRARSRVNAAAKDSARSREARTKAASRAFLRRLYHVERLTPSAIYGCFAGRRGPMPCALRQRSERKRAFSRRSASVIAGPLCLGSLDTIRPQETRTIEVNQVRRRIGYPHFGFPRDFGKVSRHERTRREGGHIDQASG